MEWRSKEKQARVTETIREASTGWREYKPGNPKSVLDAITDLTFIDELIQIEQAGGDLVSIQDLEQSLKAAEFISIQSPRLVKASLEKIGFLKGRETRNYTATVVARRMASVAVAAGMLIVVAPNRAAAANNSDSSTVANSADSTKHVPSDEDNNPNQWQIDQIKKEVKEIEKRQAAPNVPTVEPSSRDNDVNPNQSVPPVTESTQGTSGADQIPGPGNTGTVWEQQPGDIASFLASMNNNQKSESAPKVERSNSQETSKEGKYKPLLDFIADFESDGDYNAYWHDRKLSGLHDENFTDMTVREVMAWQKAYLARGTYSTAVGRYQFISNTLSGLVDEMNIDLDTKFDEATQDKLAVQLLKRRGLNSYMSGKISDMKFAHLLSREWASLPNVIGKNFKGRKVPPQVSYYNKDGRNHALVSVAKTLAAIRAIKRTHNSSPVVDDQNPNQEPVVEQPPQVEDPLAEPIQEVGDVVNSIDEILDQGPGKIGQLLASIGLASAVKSPAANETQGNGDCYDGTELVKGIEGLELCAIPGTEVVHTSATAHWKDKRYKGTTAAGEERLAVNSKISEDAHNMVQAALADGITLKVTIGYRSPEEQCSIYVKNHGHPDVCEEWITPVSGNWKTTTLKSNHVEGKSFDVYDELTYQWMLKNGPKFGFVDDVYRKEGWDKKHFTWVSTN